MAVNRSGSVLAVDFGSVHTRAVLIDIVDGIYRMVARAEGKSTAGFPVNDLTVGLNRVLDDLSESTGRRLISEDGQVITPERPDRSGVDYFVMTASVGRPLRTVLVGLMPDVSVASGLRATSGTYVDVLETISLDDMRSEEEQLNAILLGNPDLIFITGGTEYGASAPVLRLAEVVKLALRATDERRRAAVLYAGNSANAESIRQMFDRVAPLFIAPNVRPALEDEQLESAQTQLALAFNRQKGKGGEGFEMLSEMSELGVLPTAQSYNLIVEFLGKTSARGVLALDVGSAVSTLSASLNGSVDTTIRTDLGLGHSAASLVNAVGYAEIMRWIPFNITRNEIDNYALNKSLRPYTVPETLHELYLEHALLRAGTQYLIRQSRPTWSESTQTSARITLPDFGTVIGAGAAITHTGNPAYSAMLLLDALQPTGVATLLLDSFGLIAGLGALALLNPDSVVQILDGGNLETLGTAISVSGAPRVGRTALKLAIKLSDGTTTRHEIEGGRLWTFDLPPGQHAQITASAVGGVSIGGRGRVRMNVDGGSVGIIVDTRGRLLPLARNARERAEQMPAWLQQMTGDPLLPIDPAWLDAVVEEEAKPVKEPKPAPQRGKAAEPAVQPALADDDIEEPAEIAGASGDALRAMLEEDNKGKRRGRR